MPLLNVLYKQIKSRTECDKVLLELGDEYVFITIIKLVDKDLKEFKKVFRWSNVNRFTMEKLIKEYNTIYPPAE